MINITIPEALCRTDTRRGEEFMLTTLNVRLLDRHGEGDGDPEWGGVSTIRSEE
ncbi:MAG TPA: hypothetical protein VF070_11885 [Streptosporangiaceae bacterium]